MSLLWPPRETLLIGVKAGCIWRSQNVVFNEREDLPQTKLLVDHKPSMANWGRECVLSALFGFFCSFCLYVCVPSVSPHTVYTMDAPVHIRSQPAVVNVLLYIGAICLLLSELSFDLGEKIKDLVYNRFRCEKLFYPVQLLF